MSFELVLAILATFLSVAAIVGTVVSHALWPLAPERRRLRTITSGPADAPIADGRGLINTLSPLAVRLKTVVPQSPRSLGQLRRRLTTAGYRDLAAATWFSLAKLGLAIAFGAAGATYAGVVRGPLAWALVGVAAAAGFLLPELWLSRKVYVRQKAIRNGLPDALDLFIVCLEAGSSMDRAILKASEELQIAHPALADELRLITAETRAGKPRLEAFRNFADRTRVADVRSLTAMLAQTDRFGTSVAEALRTHAEVARTKRRQRAEERAAKLGVKLVFPLVFFVFPALYAVILGPAAIRIYRVFLENPRQ